MTERVDPIRSAVARKRPIGAREAAAISEFLVRYDALEAPLDEHASPVHVTASAIVLGEPGIVLLKHRRLGRWLQPGGHLDPGETPVVAAQREAVEETGIELMAISDQLIHVDVHAGGRGHTHLDLRYLLTPAPGASVEPAPPPEESQDVAWFGCDEALDRVDDDALADLLRWIAELGIDTVMHRASWRYHGTERPSFAIDPGPGQESVWEYPRPPSVVADDRPVEVETTGRDRLARSIRAKRVLETASPPTVYVPRTDVDMSRLTRVAGASRCEWKGEACYWALAEDPEQPVAWEYPQPFSDYAELVDHLCFYPGRVTCWLDGERVRPQAGGFYGGWVTDEIVGPWKGEPGSAPW